jgi:hypothetical protein
MAESKVQKVARQGAVQQSLGACACGGKLTWVRLAASKARMVKMCDKCGTMQPDE